MIVLWNRDAAAALRNKATRAAPCRTLAYLSCYVCHLFLFKSPAQSWVVQRVMTPLENKWNYFRLLSNFCRNVFSIYNCAIHIFLLCKCTVDFFVLFSLQSPRYWFFFSLLSWTIRFFLPLFQMFFTSLIQKGIIPHYICSLIIRWWWTIDW